MHEQQSAEQRFESCSRCDGTGLVLTLPALNEAAPPPARAVTAAEGRPNHISED